MSSVDVIMIFIVVVLLADIVPKSLARHKQNKKDKKDKK